MAPEMSGFFNWLPLPTWVVENLVLTLISGPFGDPIGLSFFKTSSFETYKLSNVSRRVIRPKRWSGSSFYGSAFYNFLSFFSIWIFLGSYFCRKYWTADKMNHSWWKQFHMFEFDESKFSFLLRRTLCFLQMWLIRSKNDTNLPKMIINTPKAQLITRK